MGIKLPKKIDDNTERGKKGFNIPNGKYLVSVNFCEMKTPKGGGDNYLAVELEIMDSAHPIGEESIGFKIFDTFSFTEKAAWRLASFLDACYPPKFSGDDIDIVGKKLVVNVKTEEYAGYERPRCNSFDEIAGWKGVTTKVDKEGGIAETGEAPKKDAGGNEEVAM